MMTFAEQLEAKGIQKGIQQGKQEGYQEATRKLAKQLLDDGVGRDHVKRYTGLSDEQLDTLTQ
ncbi:hypothetical protein [Candidatus Williamhamiltonella defendens]|nr:hypothetical protein [Candidatus Hamiltonella defensa]